MAHHPLEPRPPRGLGRWSAQRWASGGPLGRSPTDRWAMLFCGLVGAAGLATLPWARVTWPVDNQAVSVIVTLQIAATALTALLLVGRFVADGDRHRLAAASVFAGTSVILVVYAMSFPGVWTPGPLLGSGGSSAVWLWALYHVAFSVGLALSTLAILGRRTVAQPYRGRAWLVTISSTVAAGLLIAVTVVLADSALPVTIGGGDYTAFARGPGVVAALLVGGAVVLSLWGRGPIRHPVPPILTVALVDGLLTLYARERYAVGWYVGRVMFLAAVSALLVTLLADTVTAFRRLAEQADAMHAAAVTDTLTGLPNRRVLSTDGEPLLPGAAPARSLAVMDLDRFKDLNDTYGHAIGDVVLAAVARRLRAHLRTGDLLLRWGGDEMLLVSALDHSELALVLDRMRHAVRDNPVRTPAGPIEVSISIGAAHIPLDGNLDPAFSAADRLLQSAKRGGRDRIALPGPDCV